MERIVEREVELDLDLEWVQLLTEAKKNGITPIEIREFLRTTGKNKSSNNSGNTA